MRWHYTCGLHMESIIRDGFIKPADAHVAPPERPRCVSAVHAFG